MPQDRPGLQTRPAQHINPDEPQSAHIPGLPLPPAPPAPPAPPFVLPVQVEPTWQVPPGQQFVPAAPQDEQIPIAPLVSHPRFCPQELLLQHCWLDPPH
jgi:hypothetical protein